MSGEAHRSSDRQSLSSSSTEVSSRGSCKQINTSGLRANEVTTIVMRLCNRDKAFHHPIFSPISFATWRYKGMCA